MTIRVDNEGVPCRVQRWSYGGAWTFCIALFDGRSLVLDMDRVRELSCRGYQDWDRDADQMAIDLAVDLLWMNL